MEYLKRLPRKENGMPKDGIRIQKGLYIGTREDARSLNFFTDPLVNNVSNYRTELINEGKTITALRIIEFVKGNNTSKSKGLEEFQKYNDKVFALVAIKSV